jgi:hypothetical protein
VRLHAVVEPARLVDQQVDAVTYRFTYDDIPHNAEAIIAAPDRAKVWVVTKQLAAGTVWQVPLSTATVTRGVAVGDVGGLVTDAAMSRNGAHYVIRDYLRAYLFDAPVSGSTLASPTRVELPSELQGEAITFAPDDRALLVASEREVALWWVPLRSASTPASPSPSSSASSPAPSPSPSDSSVVSATEAPLPGPSTSNFAFVGAVLALVGAGVVGVWAARRLRH